MTATELYESSSDFRTLIATWDTDRRCPIGLVDYLLEQGLESQAECARWCANQPDLPVYAPCLSQGELGGVCGTYPSRNDGDTTKESNWFWATPPVQTHACDVPFFGIYVYGKTENADTPIKAILWLLDNWKQS